ncbi:hypothetical protein BKN38_09960 [Helicobacter sp. CLO-3]|uniref:hypothetical protein n=1 Tax=unclassified Helicobacter TaxID=2593540 RepID=UPI0008056D9D|nr:MULTISPECIES: hypothetical protein [unclassified Helicobacter]OBV30120.1 hypothetical protein BA723_09810 [Helicobacter sp. CLO-3]OHU80993.1 hypothetical protein BKN38_09960 [Helicobacter sp. CLO-3]
MKMLQNKALNQIFYGAQGAGKTYYAIDEALNILNFGIVKPCREDFSSESEFEKAFAEWQDNYQDEWYDGMLDSSRIRAESIKRGLIKPKSDDDLISSRACVMALFEYFRQRGQISLIEPANHRCEWQYLLEYTHSAIGEVRDGALKKIVLQASKMREFEYAFAEICARIENGTLSEISSKEHGRSIGLRVENGEIAAYWRGGDGDRVAIDKSALRRLFETLDENGFYELNTLEELSQIAPDSASLIHNPTPYWAILNHYFCEMLPHICIIELRDANMLLSQGLDSAFAPSRRAGGFQPMSVLMPLSDERLMIPDNLHLIIISKRKASTINFAQYHIKPEPQLLDEIFVDGIDEVDGNGENKTKTLSKLITKLNNSLEKEGLENFCMGQGVFFQNATLCLERNENGEIIEWYEISEQRVRDVLTKYIAPTIMPRFIYDSDIKKIHEGLLGALSVIGIENGEIDERWDIRKACE